MKITIEHNGTKIIIDEESGYSGQRAIIEYHSNDINKVIDNAVKRIQE